MSAAPTSYGATWDDDSSALAHALFDDLDGVIEVRVIAHPSAPDGRQGLIRRGWFPSADALLARLPQISAQAERDAATVAWGVLPRREHGAGKATDVVEGRAVWVDLDFKDYGSGEEEARGRLATFPLPPSAVVCSGHGLHAYWLLTEPTEPAELSRISTGLARALGGDSCGDAARVLRVPGTHNCKQLDHRRVCSVEQLDVDRRYQPFDFDDYLPSEPEEAAETEAPTTDWSGAPVAEMPVAVAELLDEDRRLRDLFEGRGKAEHSDGGRRQDTSSSGYDFSFVLALVARGLREPQVLAAALRGRPDGRAAAKPDAYVRRTVERALAQAETGSGGAPPSMTGPLPVHYLTELGNTARMLDRHADDFLHCTLWKRDLFWGGQHWKPDETGEHMRRVRDVLDAINAELSEANARARAAKEKGDAQGEKHHNAVAATIRKHLTASQSHRHLTAVVNLARTDQRVACHPRTLDQDPWLLATPTGTLDLWTGRLRDSDRNDRITKASPVAYDAEATAPRWEQFLGEVFGGDCDLIDFVQRAAGYTLTGSTREHKLFMLLGKGANGKSTLVEVLRYVLGDLARTTGADTLLASKHGRGIPNDIAALTGARLAAVSEIPADRKLDEALVKQLTGGDTVTARHLFTEFFDFAPQFKIWLSTNHLPTISGTDEGIWRRIVLVPFDVQVPPHKRDAGLLDTLKAEAPGILRWMVEGCLAWQRQGLAVPESCTRATADYRRQEDWVQRFLDDCFVRSPGLETSKKETYKVYERWARDEGVAPVSKNKLSRELAGAGIEDHRTNAGRSWVGIGILPDDFPQGPATRTRPPQVRASEPGTPGGDAGDAGDASVTHPAEMRHPQNRHKGDHLNDGDAGDAFFHSTAWGERSSPGQGGKRVESTIRENASPPSPMLQERRSAGDSHTVTHSGSASPDASPDPSGGVSSDPPLPLDPPCPGCGRVLQAATDDGTGCPGCLAEAWA